MGRRSRLWKAALALSVATIIPLGMMGCQKLSTREHPSHEHPTQEHPTTPEHPAPEHPATPEHPGLEAY